METNNVKVSVIIPIYNAEQYLRQCLDSVCEQTLKEIEIICVDDGSTDSSPEILKQYQEKDSRFHILRQQNQYAGVARNNGMKHAKGAYLMFWDADDFFESDALETMYERSIAVHADVCLCKVNNYYTASDTAAQADALLKMKYVPDMDVFNAEVMGDDFFRFTTMAIWNKMVRKDFLTENHIEFQPCRNANDVYFTAVEMYLAKRITVVDKTLVNYRKLDENSLTFSASNSAFSIIDAWIAAHDRISSEVTGYERSFANRALASLIGGLHMTAEYHTFCSLISKLKDGTLERMGILPPEKGFYFNTKNSDWLEKMLILSPEEFHTYFSITTFRSQIEQIQVHRGKIYKLQDRLQSKNEKLKNAQGKLEEKRRKIDDQDNKLNEKNRKIDDLENKINKLENKITKLENKNSKLENKNSKLENQLSKILDSKSYLAGRIITWLPRKICSIFKRNQ
jgi:glycosyltransferase involved in cell wall biosynthesis